MVGPLQAQGATARPRRADEAIDAILDAVVRGEHPPGSVLPAERELAGTLGISRTSLRQALTRLEQLGVVSSQQGRGTVVLDVEASTDPTLVARLVERHGTELLVEVLEVREALGALAGRLAARRGGPAEHRALAAALDRVRAAPDAAGRQRAELGFFVDLVAAARNRPLRTMLRWVEQAYGSGDAPFAAAFEDPRPVLAGLEAILDAVTAADEERAAAALEAYAAASAQRMVAAVGAERGEPPDRTGDA